MMNAQQSQIAIEQIEIAHKGLYVIQGGGVIGTAIGNLTNPVF